MPPDFRKLPQTDRIPPATRERFVKLDNQPHGPLRDFGIGQCGLSDLSEGYLMARHDAPYHVLLYVQQGKLRFAHFAEEGVAEAGERLFFPAHAYHAFGPTASRTRMVWFHFVETRAHRNLVRPHSRAPRAGECATVTHLTEGLLDEQALRRDPVFLALWESLLAKTLRREFISKGQAEPGMPPPEPGLLDTMWRTICADLAREWTLEGMASLTTYSRAHFARLCLSRYGETPMKHLTRLRMEQAEGLLMGSSLNIAEISERVGYQNAYSFSTAFRRHTGAPPAVWRGKRRPSPP